MNPFLLAFNLPTGDSSWMIYGTMGLIGMYLVLRPKKKKDPLSPAPIFSVARQRQVEDQMQSLLVELSQMARQISAQLDNRATRLELLIKEADEKIAELKGIANTTKEKIIEEDSAHATPVMKIVPDSTAIQAVADQAMDTVEISQTVQQMEQSSSRSSAISPEMNEPVDASTHDDYPQHIDRKSDESQMPATPIDQRHARIYELAEQGKTITEIAKTLARPTGEVELILALRASP